MLNHPTRWGNGVESIKFPREQCPGIAAGLSGNGHQRVGGQQRSGRINVMSATTGYVTGKPGITAVGKSSYNHR